MWMVFPNQAAGLVPWQLKIWASAQAGNRAGKTGCQQQWWDKGSEWKAVASAVWKLSDSTSFFILSPLSPLPTRVAIKWRIAGWARVFQ